MKRLFLLVWDSEQVEEENNMNHQSDGVVVDPTHQQPLYLRPVER